MNWFQILDYKNFEGDDYFSQNPSLNIEGESADRLKIENCYKLFCIQFFSKFRLRRKTMGWVHLIFLWISRWMILFSFFMFFRVFQKFFAINQKKNKKKKKVLLWFFPFSPFFWLNFSLVFISITIRYVYIYIYLC